MKDVFIVGSKGIPANYGGFETFVDNLVTRQVNPKIKYHVSCMTFNKSVKQYNYNGAECQEIYVPNIGGAKAILYDLRSLDWALDTIKERNLKNGIIYILACRIGPFLHKYIKKSSIIMVLKYGLILMDMSGSVLSGLHQFVSTGKFQKN